MSQERRLVTVVFADIVGSTAHTTAHEPELVRAVLTRAFDRLRAIVAANGGTVEKFIGDAVMAVFGVPALHEDDPERAVRAALAMRDAITALNAGSPLAIELRIGVNTGEVLAEATDPARDPALGMVTGEPVIVAARLQQAAQAGETLVGGTTRHLTSGSVEYDGPRRIDAKGIGELDAWSALRVRSVLPEQSRGIPGVRAPLIGRDAEMRQLSDVYRRVAPDRPIQMVTIFGHAGAGKSRLAAEFVDLVRPSVVLRGRCLAYGAAGSLWPVREMLQADADVVFKEERDQALTKWRARVFSTFGDATDDASAVATALAPVVVGSGEQVSPEERQWALRRYVEKRSTSSPVVLVFEDIHWAEPAVLDLIEGVAERARGAVLLLCLARPELLETRRDWGGGKRNASAIELAPLGVADVTRLVSELLAIDALPDLLKRAIAARAEGNPLYVEELIRSLMERGSITRDGRRWVARGDMAAIEVPPTIHALVAARLGRLDPELRRALQRAAVIGRTFWIDALASLDPSPGIDDRITEVERHDLVVEVGERGLRGGRGYRFSHELVRDVAYASIAKGDRAELHDSFGRWVEEAAAARVGEYISVVAHHAEQAYLLSRDVGAEAAERRERAIDRLRAAARRANDVDPRAALDLYQRAAAITLPSDPLEQRARIGGEVAFVRWRLQGGNAAYDAVLEAAELARVHARDATLVDLLGARADRNEEEFLRINSERLEIALKLHDPELTARVMRKRALWAGGGSGDVTRASSILREAEEYARRNGAATQLRSILDDLAVLELYQGHLTRWQELIAEIDRAFPSPTRMQRLTRLNQRTFAVWLGQEYQAGAVIGAEFLDAAREFGAVGPIRLALRNFADIRIGSGDGQGASELLDEALSITSELANPGQYAEMCWRAAAASLLCGDLVGADRHASEAYRTAMEEDLHARAQSCAALASVRAAQGEYTRSEALFHEALATADRTSYLDVHRSVRMGFARWLLSQQRGGEARPILEELARRQADPLLVKARAETEELIRRCEA